MALGVAHNLSYTLINSRPIQVSYKLVWAVA